MNGCKLLLVDPYLRLMKPRKRDEVEESRTRHSEGQGRGSKSRSRPTSLWSSTVQDQDSGKPATELDFIVSTGSNLCFVLTVSGFTNDILYDYVFTNVTSPAASSETANWLAHVGAVDLSGSGSD